MAANHHYLPKCYLNGFLTPGQRTFIACREDGRFFSAKPGKFARRRNYYSVPQDWMNRPENEIEEHFSRIESKANIFFKRALEQDAEPTVNDRHALIAFIAMQYARVPAQRERDMDFYLRVVEKTAAISSANTNSSFPTSGHQINKNTDIGMMLSKMSAAINMFDSMGMVVNYFDTPCFIVGDNPVLLSFQVDPAGLARKRALIGPGYDPGTDLMVPKVLSTVAMPLNRRAYVFLFNRPGNSRVFGKMSTETGRICWNLNIGMAAQCQELIASNKLLIECARASAAPLPGEWKGGIPPEGNG